MYDCTWKDISIYSNTFDNGGSGNSPMRIFPSANHISNLVIANNIITGTASTLISFQFLRSTEATSRLTLTNNLFYRFGGAGNNEWKDGTDKSWGKNYVLNDPKYINRNSLNFHLQSSSPAIDAGSNTDAPSVDFDGNPRPQGTAIDIGAYEYGSGNNPPNKPSTPIGKTNGKIGIECTYSTSTTDPNNYDLYYLFDWGDGTFSSWLGPYHSGETCEAKYTWTKSGNYMIKVKAKNSNEVQSIWSNSLHITMPYSFNNLFVQFLEWLFHHFSISFPLQRNQLE
jgi:hypothetical protein